MAVTASGEGSAPVLLVAVIGTQILATVIAAAGLLMHPLRWQLILLAWGHALIWIVLLDQIKLSVYRRLIAARAP